MTAWPSAREATRSTGPQTLQQPGGRARLTMSSIPSEAGGRHVRLGMSEPGEMEKLPRWPVWTAQW